ncbi:CNP1-like family protein [Sedimenticola sp.]|uniref:CNP1-like family protein n=1 Tax=Sedimenticola sp. TaxID=1940285 RepID=UPI003D0CE1F4
MAMNRWVVLLVMVSWGVLTLAQAGDGGNPYTAGSIYDPHESVNPNVEEYEWQEQNVEIPAFPEDENLIEFQVTRPNAAFSYFIDANSVSYTEADGVVRYTVVIKSRTGAKNVAFEGMRCTAREFKTYAFGNGKGKFVRPRKAGWKSIADNGYTRYRKDLHEFYFCNSRILDPSSEKIISELKYGRPSAREPGFR